MLFDIYPLVIHYPIAFLTFYSLLELLRFERLREEVYWFHLKAITLLVGWLSAVVALVAARMNYHQMEGVRLVEMHELFSYLVVLVYGVLLVGYLYEWFQPNKFSKFILRPALSIVLALVGLFSIVTMGGLFGAMVYGTQFDPWMKPIYILLGVY